MQTKDLFLACCEDWQGAYVDGELVDEGHEVNLIPIVNKYQFFRKASYKYLNFKTDEDFERFLTKFGGNMPQKLIELEEWL